MAALSAANLTGARAPTSVAVTISMKSAMGSRFGRRYGAEPVIRCDKNDADQADDRKHAATVEAQPPGYQGNPAEYEERDHRCPVDKVVVAPGKGAERHEPLFQPVHAEPDCECR